MWNRFKAIFCKDDSDRVRRKSDRWIFGTMLVAGVLALIASLVLTIESIHLLKNPSAKLSCSFNLVFNCATVMQTWQASVFGVPNMIIGLMSFPVVITVATLGLSRVKMPRWFLISANIGFGLSALFAYWLFFQSLYAIEVLCPWCLAVTLATTVIFSTILRYSLRENLFNFSKENNEKARSFLRKDYDKLMVVGWLAILILLIVIKYGDSLFA